MQSRFSQFSLAAWRFPAVGILAFFSLVPNASAIALGSISLTNCGAGGALVTATTISWSPAGTLAGTGCTDTGAGTSVSYSGGTLGAGALGNIQNLTFAPGGGAVDAFMTFGTLDFTLTGFVTYPALTTNCPGVAQGFNCVAFSVAGGAPFDSPFLLTNLGGGITGVSLTAFGLVTDTGDGSVSAWSGAFTTQQLALAPGTVQFDILNSIAIPTQTYSGGFTLTAIPEPASWTMLGAGLVALWIVAKRRTARA